MLGYLYKDIRINRNILCIMLGLIAFFSFFPIMAAYGDEEVGAVTEGIVFYGIYFLINGTVFFIVGMMASVFVQTDERKKWGYYNAAAPNGVRRDDDGVCTDLPANAWDRASLFLCLRLKDRLPCQGLAFCGPYPDSADLFYVCRYFLAWQQGRFYGELFEMAVRAGH